MSGINTGARVRLAIDIGGTFTDVVLDREGRHSTAKVLTTYADPADGVMTGIAQVLSQTGVEPASVDLVLHGTTLATNALIERRGAATALLTTAGHRDVLEMALENRFEQYDISIDRPAPLVPRRLRFTVPERLDATGEVLLPLDIEAVRALVPVLRANGVESLAIGFLHAWANPAHEEQAAAILREVLPDLSITLSAEVCPEIREFERFSTTCANAYVKPLMAGYLASLARKLAARGLTCPVLLMTSGGGLTDLATASAYPIRLVESGPAGGAILAAHLAATHGESRVLSFDMGGTTAKICLIDDAQPLVSRSFEVDRVYRFKKGSGLPVRIPVIEMVEIGAGGGSIARVDRLQRIQVGPESAASEPGPACYGRDGLEPTVTDADLVLGRIPPDLFAGGAIALDTAAARVALLRAVGDPLRLDVVAAAWGISAVVDENMAAAARAHAVEWGEDTAGRTLIAFGGAGPLHAVALAEKLKIDRIIVPAGAGVGSAVGFLLAPVRFEVVRSCYQRLSSFAPNTVNAVLEALYHEAEAVVSLAAPPGSWQASRRAAMRYVGQGYEIMVPVPSDVLSGSASAALRAAFEGEYVRLYGRLIPGLDVEVLSWTLALTAATPAAAPVAGSAVPDPDPASRQSGAPASDGLPTGLAPVAEIELFDPSVMRGVAVPVHLRASLPPGRRIPGPVLVAETQTTTVVPGGFTVCCEPEGHLLIERVADGAHHGAST